MGSPAGDAAGRRCAAGLGGGGAVGAGGGPLRAATAEEVANGQPVSLDRAERCDHAGTQDINPRDSWRAAKDFGVHSAVESAKRAFIEAVKLAGGEL